jgi:hypothetical protein
MEVKFSTPMKTELVDLEKLNSTQIDLYIVPAGDRDEEEGFDLSSVNFTWNATEFKKDKLTI